MTQAFYTGLSGVMLSNTAIDVLSDNIANIDTVGYRGYTTEFASLLDKNIVSTQGHSSPNDEVGIGARVASIATSQEEGSFVSTDRSSDLAIRGNGWFGVSNNNQTLYTRAGDFTFDRDNNLVTKDGMFVLGTKANNIVDNKITEVISNVPLGSVNSQEKLTFPTTLIYPPEPTTQAKLYGNLGIGDGPVTLGTSAIDTQNNRNNIKLTFTKSAVQVPPGTQWDIDAKVMSLDGLNTYDTQTASISFSENGALISSTLKSLNNNGTNVALDFGSGYAGVVANQSTISSTSESNGKMGGDLIGYEVDKNAEVVALFTNGMQSSVGKIAVYHFQNNQGLERMSGTTYAQSSNSGDAIFYQDANGQNIVGADIQNYKLENSNVELSSALTELIVMQRSYDANSKSITTADQMIQKALGMHK